MKKRLIIFWAYLISPNLLAMQPLSRLPLSLASKTNILFRTGAGATLSAGSTAALAAVAAKYGMGMESVEILGNQAVLACLGSSALCGAGYAAKEGYRKMPESRFNRAVKRLSDSDVELLGIACNNEPEKIIEDIDKLYLTFTHPRVQAFEGLVKELEATKEAQKILEALPEHSFMRSRLNRARAEGLENLASRREKVGNAIRAIKDDPTWQKRIGSYSKKRAAEKTEEAAELAKEAAISSKAAARDAKISALAGTVSVIGSWFKRR